MKHSQLFLIMSAIYTVNSLPVAIQLVFGLVFIIMAVSANWKDI